MFDLDVEHKPGAENFILEFFTREFLTGAPKRIGMMNRSLRAESSSKILKEETLMDQKCVSKMHEKQDSSKH